MNDIRAPRLDDIRPACRQYQTPLVAFPGSPLTSSPDSPLDAPPALVPVLGGPPASALRPADRKERLAGALRILGRLGYEDGVCGHTAAHGPDHPDCFWVNPFGMPFQHVTARDLALANVDGQAV
ncbi:class II aldolase/adducin family protein [Streptomyces sp. G45]|uniref:class II aldolase/adducin family protein n=1 Tax=Streptomyces sp. G45 TaxID=3406627 RepID=UPI003C20E58E